MNNVTKIVAALLVLLALLLGIYALVLAGKPLPEAAPPAQTPISQEQYPVVVADKLLPAGQAIDVASLKVVQLPINPVGAYTTPNALAGKIPKLDLGVDVPVTEGSLVKGLTLQLKDGERAVAVPVDEVVGSGNRVTPGDFVDVFFLLKQGQDINKTQARLLLSRLRVLTYGVDSVEGPVAAEPTLRSAPPAVARTAVLAVATADVNRLLLATQNGRLQLALRNPSDTTAPDLALFPEPPTVLIGKPTLTPVQREALKEPDNQAYAGSELTGLAGSSRAAAPPSRPVAQARAPVTRPAAPAVVQQNTVEVVRGTKRETVGF